MQPTTDRISVSYNQFKITVASLEERNNLLFFVPGTFKKKYVTDYWFRGNADIVVWNGHEFEIVRARVDGNKNNNLHSFAVHTANSPLTEYAVTVYYPIDPRMTAKDIAGAIRAYPNEDNTGWLFAHTDEGTHHDYELTLLAACDGVFQPLFRQYQSDIYSSTSEVLISKAKGRFVALSSFYGAVLVEAKKIARNIYLGEREQMAHPSEGWLDRDITRAVATVKAQWTKNKPTTLAILSTALTYIESSLNMPSVETRWAKAARLKAEAEAENDES